MINLKNYITEKFKISSKNIQNKYYEFEDKDLDENIKIELPFILVLPQRKDSVYIYKIEKHKIKMSGSPYWKLYDKDNYVITVISKTVVKRLIKDKKTIWLPILNLHGKPCNSSSESIYIHKDYL